MEKEQKPEKEEKKTKEEKLKKEYVTANGRNLAMSTKEAVDICRMIRGKDIDTSLKLLEEVLQFKRAVKMNRREVPHRHGKGMMAGRYPIAAVKEFIRLAKQLKSNALHQELEIEKYVLFCKADKASRPYRRDGRRFKRTHVLLKLEKLKENKNKEKG